MTDPEPGRHSPAYEIAPADVTEPKVYAATGGSVTGVITANFVLYLLAGLFYHGGVVPQAVALFVGLVITTGLTYAGGYIAHHVNRIDPGTTP